MLWISVIGRSALFCDIACNNSVTLSVMVHVTLCATICVTLYFYRTIHMWNKLSLNIREIPSHVKFKLKCKDFF